MRVTSYKALSVKAALDATVESTVMKSESDKAFIGRCYNEGDLDKYRARARAIGLSGHECVLDAGCGYGQWSIVFSELNKQVVATDVDVSRIEIASSISKSLAIKNIEHKVTPMTKSELKEERFDAIFSYNALPLSPFKQTLSEFYRILKPGGLLYFNAYDLGWMVYNIIDIHKPAADFDPRQWSIDTIQHTVNYLGGAGFAQKGPRDGLFVPQEVVRKHLVDLGFEVLSECGDGMTSTFGDFGQEAFFPSEKYGLPAVYEFLCKKR